MRIRKLEINVEEKGEKPSTFTKSKYNDGQIQKSIADQTDENNLLEELAGLRKFVK